MDKIHKASGIVRFVNQRVPAVNNPGHKTGLLTSIFIKLNTPIDMGKIHKASGTVRFVNQRVPSVNNPGHKTGNAKSMR